MVTDGWKLWILVKKKIICSWEPLQSTDFSVCSFEYTLIISSLKKVTSESSIIHQRVERRESWKNEKVYALVLPVCVRVWVLRWSDRENFLWQVSHWNGLTPTHTQEHTSVVTHTHTEKERTSTGYRREAMPKCVRRGKKHSYIKYVRPTSTENSSNTSANTCAKRLRKP